MCDGFGQDRVNFLCSSYYRAMFWICAEIVLIAQGCLRYCWAVPTQSQGLFCFSPHPTSEQAGGAEEVGRGHSWESWPQLAKGIFPYSTVSCSAYKAGGKKGGGERSEWWCLSSPVTVMRDGALLLWRWLNACLPYGKHWMNSLLACMAFALPIKFFISTHEFSHFYSFDFLPQPTVGDWARGCVVLGCRLRLNHDRMEEPAGDPPTSPTLGVCVHPGPCCCYHMEKMCPLRLVKWWQRKPGKTTGWLPLSDPCSRSAWTLLVLFVHLYTELIPSF